MRRRDLLGGLSLVPLATPAVAQCVVATFPRINLADRCEGGDANPPSLDLTFMVPGQLDPRIAFTRASTGTYFDSAGVMQSAAIDAPRWDHDPTTRALRGLLLEDQAQNVLTNSNITAGWTAQQVTAAVNSGTAPDATNTMTRIAETAVTNFHTELKGAITITASVVYTLSVYARAQEVRYLQMVFDDAGSNGSSVAFDLQTGAISGSIASTGTAANATAFIQPVGNATYRCILTTSLGAVTTGRVAFALSNAAAPSRFPVYAGNAANGLLLWGAQLERRNFATSLIPTTAGAVTRSIDSCLIPPANMASWFTGSPGGSWFAEFGYFDTTPSNSRLIGRPDTAGGVSPLLLNATRNVVQNDGAALATANATTAGAVTKACSTWAAGSARICADGGAIASSAALATGYGAFTAAGIRFLSVGAALGTDNTSGHIRAVRYWPAVLTDAQMQAITS